MRNILILISCLLTIILVSSSSFADTGDVQVLRGQLVCVQVDESGMANVSKEFTECEGLLYLLGVNGNLYSLHGSEEEMKKINESSKSRMGYRVPLRLKGKALGHQRAWQIYTPSLEPDNSSIKTTVTGTVLCLFPNFNEGDVEPKVAGGPCNEAEPHAHFIQTREGKIYALHGTLEDIISIEKSSDRENVTLTGVLKANESGWILYVN